MDESVYKHMVRIGTVSSVNLEKRTVRVIFDTLDGMVSAELKVLNRNDGWMPQKKEKVVCLYIPVFNGDGFIIGGL